MRRITLAALAMFFVFASIGVAAPAPPRLTEVAPWQYDPFNGSLVESDWINHIGCPFQAEVNTPAAGTYTDPACPTQYRADPNVQGLLLAKTGPTANIAAAGAELKGVRGIVITSIGYDIRKFGGFASPLGSHCGAGSPRFNVVTIVRDALHRLRLAAADLAGAGPGLDSDGVVDRRRVPADPARRRRRRRSTSSSTRARTPVPTTSGSRSSTTSWSTASPSAAERLSSAVSATARAFRAVAGTT